MNFPTISKNTKLNSNTIKSTLIKTSINTIKNYSLPTVLSNNKCGSKSDGIFICKNNLCCSKYGYCGKTDAKECNPEYGKCW